MTESSEPLFYSEIVSCRRCPRLVKHRERVALAPPLRFRAEKYWARPVPGFGDLNAKMLILGLAPAAHGANRTGRLFTGDRSGEFLFKRLYKAGLSSKELSESAFDDLTLKGVYITAAVKCAPPDNRPSPEEAANCFAFLKREWEVLSRTVRVILALGAFAHRQAARLLEARPLPRFYHGAEFRAGAVVLLASYHPSQQNTFTGRLSEAMFDDVLKRAKELAGLV